MKTVGNTQLAAVTDVKSILRQFPERQEPTVLLRHNRPVAALISIDRYNAYLALENLIQHPDLFDRLRASAKEARKTPLAMLRTLDDLECLEEPEATGG